MEGVGERFSSKMFDAGRVPNGYASAEYSLSSRARGSRGRSLARSLVNPDQSHADRVQRQLHPIADLQLLEDVVQVRLHRDLADRQPPGDLGIAEADRDVPDDLALPG